MKCNIKTILRIMFVLSCVNLQAMQPNTIINPLQAAHAQQLPQQQILQQALPIILPAIAAHLQAAQAQQLAHLQAAQAQQLALLQAQRAQLAIQAIRRDKKYIGAGTQLFLNLIGLSPLYRITLGSIIMGVTSKGYSHPNVSTADVVASYFEGAVTVEFYRFMFDAIQQVILSYR